MDYKRENKEDELKKEHLTLYAPLTSYNETEKHKPQISHRQNRWHWVLLLAFFSHSSIFYYIFSVTARRRRRKEKTTQAALQLFTYEFYVFFGRLVLFLSMRCDAIDFSSCFNSCFISLIVCRWADFFLFYTRFVAVLAGADAAAVAASVIARISVDIVLLLLPIFFSSLNICILFCHTRIKLTTEKKNVYSIKRNKNEAKKIPQIKLAKK